MARYGLVNHVFLCADEEYIVVLDLRRDRYFTFDATRTAALSPELPGWPTPPPASDNSISALELTAEEAAAPLLRQGWLLEAPAASKAATPVQSSPPRMDLLAALKVESPTIGARAVVTFVIASVFAKLALRFLRLERVIRRVAERKTAHPGARRPVDVARLRQLVDTFARLRIFLFSHRGKCLHDSLSLLEFLARHGIFPDWVFGVRARPFAAHCWVQYEDMVCNDTVEHVTGYIPIMVV